MIETVITPLSHQSLAKYSATPLTPTNPAPSTTQTNPRCPSFIVHALFPRWPASYNCRFPVRINNLLLRRKGVSLFDLILTGGTVIDGTGSPRTIADVAVSGDRIAAVGKLASVAALRSLDCTGRIVAPGLIDVHNHSDGWMLVH